MTPTWSTGANKKSYHYYACTLRQRTASTACTAAWLPAEEIEEFVVGELRSFSMSKEEISYVVERANGDRGEELERKREELAGERRRRAVVQKRVDELIRAVEGGGGFSGTIQSRLAELEEEIGEIDAGVTTLVNEVHALEEVTVSAETLSETFEDFPAIWDRLIADGDRFDLRDQIRRMIEVAEWSWDSMDKRVGTVELGLSHPPKSEAPQRVSGRTAEHPLPVSSGCSLKLLGREATARSDRNLVHPRRAGHRFGIVGRREARGRLVLTAA